MNRVSTESSSKSRSQYSTQDRLAQAVDEFYADIDAGKEPDRDRLLKKYSDVADELSDCLQNLDFITNVAPQLAEHRDAGSESDASTRSSSPVSLGDFRIIREIGRGGMGVVYEAEQQLLGRRVAIKVLPFAAMLDEQQRARFQIEARAAATLDHPNVVHVHSVGVERGIYYYAMQYVEGHSLAEFLKAQRNKVLTSSAVEATCDSDDSKKGRKPSVKSGRAIEMDTVREVQLAISTERDQNRGAYHRSIAKIGIQIAEGLQHAHERGVIHRDIKPANIMLDAQGSPLITDFGLARVEGDKGLTLTGDIVGTLRYSAPEQALGKRSVVDERADVYSLGATLYELLTLRPVFCGENRGELLKQITIGVTKRLRALDNSIPVDLETIVLRAIDQDPDQRYNTAIAMAEDLHRFLQQRPIVARRPHLVQHVTKWIRRNQTIAWSLLFALVTLVFSSSLLSFYSYRAMRQEAALRQEAEDATERAEHFSRVAQKTIDDFLTQFGAELQNQPNAGVLSKRMYLSAMDMYQLLLSQSEPDAELRFKAAKAFAKAAEQLRLSDQRVEAIELFHDAADIFRSLIDEHPVEGKYRVELAKLLALMGASYRMELDYKSSLDALEEGIKLLDEFDGQGYEVEMLVGRVLCHSKIGDTYHRMFLPAKAEWHFARSVQLSENVRKHKKLDEDIIDLILYADSVRELGIMAQWRNRCSNAELHFKHSMDLLTEHVQDPDRNRLLLTFSLGAAQLNYAELLTSTGRSEDARELLEETIKSFKELQKEHSEKKFVDGFLEWCYEVLAETHFAMGAPEAAADRLRESLKTKTLNIELRPDDPFNQLYVGWDRFLLGDLLYAAGATVEASELLTLASNDLYEVKQTRADGKKTHVPELIRFLALCPDVNANPGEAALLARELAQPDSCVLLQLQALAELQAGDYAKAIEACKSAMDLRLGGDAVDWVVMALALAESGDLQQAAVWYQKQADAPSPQSPICTLNCTLPQFHRLRDRATGLLDGLAMQPQAVDQALETAIAP